MDLYALGQVIQWMIMGKTHTGTGRDLFSTKIPEYGMLDNFVDQLIQSDPKKRPQTVAEANDLLEKCINPKKFLNPDLIKANNQSERCGIFHERLVRSLPGATNYSQLTSQVDIDRVLHELSQEYESYELWWTQGHRNFTVDRLIKDTDDVWLMGIIECKIIDLWIHRSDSYEREYVIIHTKAMQSFGLPNYHGIESEEVGFFQGKYIHLNEVDDGYTLINGYPQKLTGVDRRERFFSDQFFLLTPKSSLYLGTMKNDDLIDLVIKKLTKNKKITQEIIQDLENAEREYWMTLLL
jgi:hypothetical protein